MRITLAMAVACLSMGLSIADEAHAAIKKDTTIPAQGLGSALKQLANERDIQLVYRSEIVGERQTSGAVGELSVDEALTKLLTGTGLTYQYIDERAITIVPMGSSPQHSALSTQSSRDGVWGRFRLAQAEQGSSKPSSSSVEDLRRVTLEEVIVTAQKREERLQDVPISISVLAGDQLDRTTAKDVSEMLGRVPGVAITPASNFGTNRLNVRGVGAAAEASFGSSPIAFYLDGAPFGFVRNAILPDATPFDLDRVEVLRGPQGTLYGANAQNGVVRVLTKDPNLTDWAVKARTYVSSTEHGGENYRGDVAINVPLVPEKLAMRAVAGYQSLSGWIDSPTKRGVNDGKARNLRLKLAAQPTDQLSITASSWVVRSDFDMPSRAEDLRQSPVLRDEPYSQDYDVHGLRVEYEGSGFSISSMTSYLDYAMEATSDFNGLLGLPFDNFLVPLAFANFDSKVFSEEVLLQSIHGGPWRWSLGGMYRDAEDRWFQRFLAPVPADFTDGSESVAVFGELARRFFNNKLEASLGLRYFQDDVITKENIAAVPGTPLVRETASFNSTTPRAVLTWYPTSELTVYGSYAEGFRSGFPQQPGIIRLGGYPPPRPDELHNYELGVKGSVWDRRLAFDVALFYIDWQDVQQQQQLLVNGFPTSVAFNGVGASGAGVDVGMFMEPVAGLELGANFSWNGLEMDAPTRNLAGVIIRDKGDRLANSPEYTVGTSASYGFPLGKGGVKGRLSVSANYTSEQPFQVVVAGVSQYVPDDPQLITRASFSLDAPARWSATIFVDNINNEQGATSGSNFAAQFPTALSHWVGRPRPRTIGVQFEYGL